MRNFIILIVYPIIGQILMGKYTLRLIYGVIISEGIVGIGFNMDDSHLNNSWIQMKY